MSDMGQVVEPAVAALVNAPPEDEIISKEEEDAVAEARRSLGRNGGRGVPHAEAMRLLELV